MKHVHIRFEQLPAPLRRRLRWLWRYAGPALTTRAAVRRWALASVIANAVVICTGAAVRLSSSGLGCPDWPRCSQTSALAGHTVGQTTLNTWIEQGNRLLNGPLSVIVGLTFIACLVYKENGRRRRDLVWLSALLPLGVIAQAVLGGITVLTDLNPFMVSSHFLVSALVLLPAAVVLHVRVAEGSGPARSLVRADLRVMAAVLAGVTALMLAAGTVVTGTGPLTGTATDSHGHVVHVPRFPFTLESVTQFHADIAWFLTALAVALVIGTRFADGTPRATVRGSRIVVGWIVAQGVIGYVQYFNHLPAGLVWVHVASSMGLWISVMRLYLSTRERLRSDTPDLAAETLTAAS